MKFKATLNVMHENTYFMLYKHFKSDNRIASFLFDHFLMSSKALMDAGKETSELPPPEYSPGDIENELRTLAVEEDEAQESIFMGGFTVPEESQKEAE